MKSHINCSRLYRVSGGIIGAYIMTKIPLKYVKKYALPLAILSLLVTALVFVPGVGVRSGGAVRWIDLGFISFQPVEILKYSDYYLLRSMVAYSDNMKGNIWYTLVAISLEF
jgi:cell division protein FtsW